MSNYNWCHGPECHTTETKSRIRGSGDNKVLRPNKIKHDSNYRTHERYNMFNYFCGNNCLFDYIRAHLQAMIAIAPRREALETPIKVEKTKYESTRYEYDSYSDRSQRVPYMATRTTIKSVDND